MRRNTPDADEEPAATPQIDSKDRVALVLAARSPQRRRKARGRSTRKLCIHQNAAKRKGHSTDRGHATPSRFIVDKVDTACYHTDLITASA